MFEVLILAMLALPVGGALYHWAWFKRELAAMDECDAHNAHYVPAIAPPRRKVPSKADTKATLAQRALERKVRRRFSAPELRKMAA